MKMDNLENMDIDDIQNEMKKFRFNQEQLKYFKEQEFDGIVIANLNNLPDFPSKTVGSVIKFKAFIKKMTGKEFSDKDDKFIEKPSDCTLKTNETISSPVADKTSLETITSSLVLGSNLTEHVKEVSNSNSCTDFNDCESSCDLKTTFHEKKTVHFMPVFGPSLENDLNKARITKNTFMDMINETVKYYRNFNVRLDTKTQYKEISEHLIRKYPSVVNVLEKERLLMNDSSCTEKNEAQLVSILSQRISKKNRNSRYLNKSNTQAIVSKGNYFESSNYLLEREATLNDENEYESLHLKLQEMGVKRTNFNEMSQLLMDTFVMRREQISELSLSLNEKLIEYNFLNTEDTLINEFSMIIGSNQIEKNLEKLFDIFESELIFKDFPKKNNEQYLNILVEVEMKINSKSKKNEWKPICLVYDITEPIDFENNLVQSPRLFVIKNGLSIEKYLIVNLEQVLIEIPKEKSFIRVLTILFSYYFVFEIDYDCKLENILIFLEKILFQSKRKEKNKKTLTYLKYLSTVKDKYDDL